MAENSNNDCVASNLLFCTETKSSLYFDDLDFDQKRVQENNKVLSFNNNGKSETLLIDLLPSLSDESFGFMLKREKDFCPKDDYLKRLRIGDLDLNVRREALNWIWKAHVHYGFGELSFCLSINYLDRFLSLYELPRGKTWTIQLLAVACLSLAVKMEEINVPLTVDLQVEEPKFLFEGKTIQRMELLVLSTLKWRMQAYTPCKFIDYFMRKMNLDEIQSKQLISRSMQLILNTIKGIDFLEFRPSEIAAAVAMSVSLGERPQAKDIDKAMPCFSKQVEKDRVMKCLELIQDLTLVSGTSVTTTAVGTSVPQSPNGVLEAACLSYKSGEGTVGSCPNSSHSNSPDAKRRKLDTTSSIS
ncbi:PREDICTED: cyclin-D4-1-like [Nicotiana attenuata]|uniref:Cyclin-d2-1 n=1 Tax=Nicotiana attenuata TaxID=49451 RepID=A0A1J6HSQ7_NICAT|nr:PREDICTED: cyclin-D4-1-like [Nicotiana attenuata]OIS95948.1 cyclin-d2-1 [Nicotiana attenuata]